MTMNFDEEIMRFVEQCIRLGMTERVGISRIVTILMCNFNKRSLASPTYARGWLPRFFSSVEYLGFGHYDTVMQELVFNAENETVKMLIDRYSKDK